MEEHYTSQIIDLLEEWKNECEKCSILHKKLSKAFYLKHVIFSIPPLVIPTIMVFVSNVIEDKYTLTISSSVGFLITGLFTGLNQFFNFNLRSERHENSEFRYQELVNYTNNVMSRNENYRIPADVLLEKMRTEIKNLSQYSPSTENTCVSMCCMSNI